MAHPVAWFQLPDGSVVSAGPDAIVGRSPQASVRIDDPRISTIHAELSWRAEGFVLIARGGRMFVGGRAVREVALVTGLEIALAPCLSLRVARLEGGEAPVIPPTAGRERLRVTLGSDDVKVYVYGVDAPLAHLTGVPARIVGALARRRGSACSWDAIAELAWPDDAAIRGTPAWTDVDERRLRNRWDQQLVTIRRQLEPVRSGQFLNLHQGVVELVLRPGDDVDPEPLQGHEPQVGGGGNRELPVDDGHRDDG